MNEILLDSCIIIAYALLNDDTHDRAEKIFNEYDLFNQECYVTTNVIAEVVTVIGNKSNLNLAKEVYYIMKDNFIILNEQNIFRYLDNVMNTYAEYNTKLSFVDSSILEVMKYYDIDTLTSFDKQFKRCSEINLIQ